MPNLVCSPAHAGAYEAAMRTLDGWDWDAIVPCHGEVVRAGGKRLLRAHLGRACRLPPLPAPRPARTAGSACIWRTSGGHPAIARLIGVHAAGVCTTPML